MKFKSTTYTNPRKQILKFVDHYLGMAVMLDDTGIVANADGKKIIPAGTILGGGFLDSLTAKAKKAASYVFTTALAAGKNLTFTAKVPRAVKIKYVDPSGNDKALAISMYGPDSIQVSLATGPAGAITSTANDIMAAINADHVAGALVSVTVAKDEDGTGVVTALTEKTLADGVPAEGVLYYDVDVTYGATPGTAIIHGFINVDAIPTAPTAADLASLGGRLLFLK